MSKESVKHKELKSTEDRNVNRQADIRQGDGTINRQGTNREQVKQKEGRAVNHKGGNNKKQNTHAGSKNTISNFYNNFSQ